MNKLLNALKEQKQERDQLKQYTNSDGDSSKKWIKKSELEDAQKRKYLHQLEQQPPLKKLKTESTPSSNIDPSTTPSSEFKDADIEALSQLSKQEVFKILRKHGQPVTLFGETDHDRLKRLRLVQIQMQEYVKGQRNEFGQILKDQEEKLEQEKILQNKQNEPSSSLDFSGLSSVSSSKEEKDVLVPKEPNQHDMDYIRSTFRRLLKLWEKNLEKRTLEVKKSAQGREDYGIWKQTKDYMKPLLKKLKRKELEEDVAQALSKIVTFMVERKYLEANDTYLELAIGNAPWPMGVTMVGIHERSAREKIERSAHILNDETSRKYIQCVKRLISFCQKMFPLYDPSKMVL